MWVASQEKDVSEVQIIKEARSILNKFGIYPGEMLLRDCVVELIYSSNELHKKSRRGEKREAVIRLLGIMRKIQAKKIR